MEGYLEHHGIKGMKWGVRRYQNEDGSLTPAGEQRYNGNMHADKKDREAYLKESAAYERDAKKAASKTNKSKHVQKLEQEYREKGMSEEDAAVAAYRRAKTEKIIAATIGVAVVAGLAYGGYKYYQNYCDKTIKAGSTLQNLSTNATKGVEDAFYFTNNEVDNRTYRGMFATELQRFGGNVYKTDINVTDNLKVASPKSAEKVFKNLMDTDSDFKNVVTSSIAGLEEAVKDYPDAVAEGHRKLIEKAANSVKQGKIDSSVYDAYNSFGLLYSPDADVTSAKNKFFSALKRKGYDVIEDVNDKKYSGYNSKNPLIALGDMTKKMEVGGRSVLTLGHIAQDNDWAINRLRKQAFAKEKVKDIAKSPITYAGLVNAGALGAAAIASNKKKTNDRHQREAQVVAAYKDEHPNSQLSNKEILDNYYNSSK